MRAWLWAVSPDLYPTFVGAGTLALERVGRRALYRIDAGDTVFVYLTDVQALAGMFEAVGTAFEDATALVPGRRLPHRLRVRALADLAPETRLPASALDGRLALAEEPGGLRASLARVVSELPATDARVLGFLVRAREAGSVEKALDAFDRLEAIRRPDVEAPAAPDVEENGAPRTSPVAEPGARYEPAPFRRAEAAEALLAALDASGFVYAPWQVAAYLAAVRTKPFVLLAGPTGTGKSRLPVLVEDATGGAATLVPVRPDWTDSAESLGYTDLQGRFRPGSLLTAAHRAALDATRHHALVLDEMNLARPEHYLAEVLSRLETRRPAGTAGDEGFASPPLLPEASDAAWASVGLPANLALVGTVNVDESAHAFSRKVLDRAFVLELGEVDLAAWRSEGQRVRLAPWPASAWRPRALTLAGLGALDDADRAEVERAVRALVDANALLGGAALGYRLRDEVVLFCLHARELPAVFRTRGGAPVDPLDVALTMKVLPRLAGSRHALGAALLGLLGWSTSGAGFASDRDAARTLDAWREQGRPSALGGARFPRTAARLARMLEQAHADGFASFWT